MHKKSAFSTEKIVISVRNEWVNGLSLFVRKNSRFLAIQTLIASDWQSSGRWGQTDFAQTLPESSPNHTIITNLNQFSDRRPQATDVSIARHFKRVSYQWSPDLLVCRVIQYLIRGRLISCLRYIFICHISSLSKSFHSKTTDKTSRHREQQIIDEAITQSDPILRLQILSFFEVRH